MLGGTSGTRRRSGKFHLLLATLNHLYDQDGGSAQQNHVGQNTQNEETPAPCHPALPEIFFHSEISYAPKSGIAIDYLPVNTTGLGAVS